MARKEYDIKFSLKAELAKQFGDSFSSAEKSMSKLKKEMTELNSTASDVKGYQKHKEQLEKNEAKISALQKEYQRLQNEERLTGDCSDDLRRRYKENERQFWETTEKIKENKDELEKLEKKLKDAGVDTANLSEELKKLEDAGVDIANLSEEIEKLDKAIDKNNEYLNKSLSTLGKIAAIDTAALAAVYKGAVEPSIEFESAFTGVEKTVDGTADELDKIRSGILKMSTQLPTAASDIAAVAESAGQLGIHTENILDFTRTMVDLGESTNLSSDEAASALAKFANVTGMSQDNFGKLGSVIVDLGNHYATTESDIVSMATRLASAGTVTGLTQSQIMALSTALSSVGIEAEAGGSAASKILKEINLASETYENATSVIESTGYSLRDLQLMASNSSSDFKGLASSMNLTTAELKRYMSNADALENFAKVAGMTAEEFQKEYGKDSLRALSLFIQGLNDTERNGKSAVEILDEMGITEVRMSNAVLSLATSGDLLTSAVDMANEAWEDNTALTKEAEKRYETTESKMTMAKNAAENFGVAVGDVLTPKVADLAEKATDMLTSVTEWVEENPEQVESLLETAGAIGSVVTGYAAMKVGVLAVKKVVLDFKKVLAIGGGFGVGMGAAAAFIAAVTVAIKLNNDAYQKLRREYLDSAFFDNGGAKLSDFTETLKGSTSESKSFAEQINITADEVDEIQASITDARNQIKIYGTSLKEDAILTPEEAEALQEPFMELGNLLEEDFTVKYNAVFDAFKIAASDVADSLGVDISEIESLLDSFKEKYTGELTESQSVVNDLLERQSNGETLTDEDYQKLRDEMSFYNAMTAQKSDALYNYNQAIENLGRIDLGANQEEAIENIKSLNEYASDYLAELDEAQKQLNKYYDDERQNNQTLLDYGKITQEEYDNNNNALNIAQGITYESYKQNRSDFQNQVRDQINAISDMIDEEVLNAVDENGISFWDFTVGTIGNMFNEDADILNGDFSKEQYKLARANAINGAREIYSGVINEVSDLNSTIGVPPIYIPLEVENSTSSYIAKTAIKKPSNLAAYASGTNYSKDTFIAGEAGPELITGAKGRKVFTAAETAHINENIANMGNSVSVSVSIPSVVVHGGNSEEIQEQLEAMAQSIAFQVERAINDRAADNRRMEY